jgi:hypothetical protein
MIRRSVIVTLIVAAAVALGPTAFAKGPLGAMIEGEGVTGSLVIDEPGEIGQGTAMSELVEAAGFFPLVFGDGAVTTNPPTKATGKQRIVITWDLGDGDTVVEEIYHRAADGPLAYVAISLYTGADGSFLEDPPRLVGNTLIWETGGVTLRLESALTMEDALTVARSMRSPSE